MLFKGLAVSIHADGPIAEHSIQKRSRSNRISSYIPVPPARVPPTSTTGQPEQSTFAISITLLTPGLSVPYSTPKATPDDPYPKPRVVGGGLPGYSGERGKYLSSIPPYIPRTTNPNETIAAYIYFDGRAKEEVATLLRRGEETWVNSRWVSVPDSEGGGLAEREFLFREVGLERWLNGLDLQGSGKERQRRIERRQLRLEKNRRKQREQKDSDDESGEDKDALKRIDRNGVLRYSGKASHPIEEMADDDGDNMLSDSDSDDEPPQPEAAGQIKVALFRVLASGEVKRGEYSPQFDAHDDDEMENGNGDGDDGDVDHTTSFAKPKTLDPKTISTQTVTGLDPPESPYAVFTFFYRGEKQLQKMGILSQPDTEKTTQSSSKRKSSGPDFSKLGPLKSTGTVGFSGYRDDSTNKLKKNKKGTAGDAMDSDADDEDDERLPDGGDDLDVKQEDGSNLLSPEDAQRTGEIADGVQKIKLKRQHSAEPESDLISTRKSPHMNTEETSAVGTPQSVNSTAANAGTPPHGPSLSNPDSADAIASPYKRPRNSVPELNSDMFAPLGPNANAGPFLPATSLKDRISQQEPSSTPEIKREVGQSNSDVEL